MSGLSDGPVASASMKVQVPSPSVVTTSTPRLREAAFSDYPHVARLRAARGLRVRSCEEWRHLWEDNPAYIERHGKWPVGWVLETGTDVVGYVGNMPTRYTLNGREFTAGCAYSWIVMPAYSAYSILLLHEFLQQRDVAFCISTTAGLTSYKAHTALGAVPATGSTWNRSCVWITSYTGMVSSWLERKKWPMARAISYPISAVLYARDTVRKRLTPKNGHSNGHIQIECCRQFDEQFDAFWQELQAHNPDRLLAERSRRALAWHFQYALHEEKLWIATVKEGSSLRAYAIFKLLSNANDKPQRLAFVDFQSVADGAMLFYSILDWALERCSSEGIHLLETIGLRPDGIGDLSALAPYRVAQEGWPLYKAIDASLAKKLKDPNVWSPCLYDGDASV
jgi:hypothetical protein